MSQFSYQQSKSKKTRKRITKLIKLQELTNNKEYLDLEICKNSYRKNVLRNFGLVAISVISIIGMKVGEISAFIIKPNVTTKVGAMGVIGAYGWLKVKSRILEIERQSISKRLAEVRLLDFENVGMAAGNL